MEPHALKRLETRVAQEVQTLLTEGDAEYLHSLSPTELCTALKDELYFLGVYHHDDVAAHTVVQDYLTRHLPLWFESIQKRSPGIHGLSSVPR